jgi:hypothetical protein
MLPHDLDFPPGTLGEVFLPGIEDPFGVAKPTLRRIGTLP